MATAIFNTNIETPAPIGKIKSYDLNFAITKEGFGDYLKFNYTLGKQYLGVSLVNNILNIDENAYGGISVTVSAGDKIQSIEANASTKLYGFYATSSEIINTTATANALQVALANAQKDWLTLVDLSRNTG